ncbi:MAG: response regulator [Pseudomonadota bacterium]
MSQVLVLEDEDIIRKQIVLLLERNDYVVTGVATVDEALALALDKFDIILADIRLPGADGTEIIKHSGQVPVVVMTSFASVRSAVESMKLGAVNYISKPFDHDELLLVIARSLHENRMSSQNAAMKKDLARNFPLQALMQRSEVLKDTLQQLRNLPDKQSFVFVHGERGVGKELAARMVHDSGSRADGPLVFVDLPSYHESELNDVLFGSLQADGAYERHGMLHAANAGTLVIRSVELLPADVQRHLMALTTRTTTGSGASFNVRVLAVSALTPAKLAANGDLDAGFVSLFDDHTYGIAPLRSRREDIEPLAQHYLELFVKRYRRRRIVFSTQALNAMTAYQWPGNITEMRSVIERAVLMVETDEIMPVHLGIAVVDGVVTQTSLDLSLDEYFRYFVLTFQGQLSETELASKLGISRKALWERRHKMGLSRP